MEKQNKKNGTFGRLLRYIYKNYRVYMITVIICIIIAAAASVVQTVFLQRLIDTCILPGLESGFESIRQPFTQTILSMVTLYVFGVAAAFTYTHLMATVTQGTLKHLRVDMFDKMQSLPIKYFDTHAHGDIMSTYTNDTDAIRQLIGQSLPMVFQSSLTITVMFLMMIYYSVWMTLVVCLFSALMLTVTKKFGGASSRYMMAQQRSLAKEEGFIEEMIQGQKVVKVFCHEDECKKDFDKLNEQLFSDGEQANRYGNSLMPILNNVGNLMFGPRHCRRTPRISQSPELKSQRFRCCHHRCDRLLPRYGKTALPDHRSGLHAGCHDRHGSCGRFPCVRTDR